MEEVFNRADVIEVNVFTLGGILRKLTETQERHRIDVDCRRTDRTQPLFMVSSPPITPSSSTETDDEKEATRRFSAISPSVNDVGSQAPTNQHIERMATILLTYNFFEKQLGISSPPMVTRLSANHHQVMFKACRTCVRRYTLS